MDVSIVIVNWNAKELLRDCLNSVCEQTLDIDYEILVIDNASTDGSSEMVRNDFQQVILIENTENRGFAAANNQGIAQAAGRYVLLLNSDTIVCDRAIEKTAEYADEHPDAAVVGCQVWEDSDTIQLTCFRFPSVADVAWSAFGLARLFPNNRTLGRQHMLWWRRDSEREVDVVSGMFMMVRRAAIAEVGPMDEDYFLYFEETDWCYRLARAGWKMLFWPGARIIHCHGGSNSSNKAAARMFVQFQKSLCIFFKKHYGLLSCTLARGLLVVSLGSRCCLWAAKVLLRKVSDRDVNSEKAQVGNYWAAFRFCAFGSEPK
ncbi:MAG: glycosyltransferase family 2 protein [Phycisphaerales bacterium]|nr:MAG: glycosyltransferase family 2 protein [Phycisphaerales bacterium]